MSVRECPSYIYFFAALFGDIAWGLPHSINLSSVTRCQIHASTTHTHTHPQIRNRSTFIYVCIIFIEPSLHLSSSSLSTYTHSAAYYEDARLEFHRASGCESLHVVRIYTHTCGAGGFLPGCVSSRGQSGRGAKSFRQIDTEIGFHPRCLFQ